MNVVFFFQAEDGIRDRSPSRGLGDVYKRQLLPRGGEAPAGPPWGNPGPGGASNSREAPPVVSWYRQRQNWGVGLKRFKNGSRIAIIGLACALLVATAAPGLAATSAFEQAFTSALGGMNVYLGNLHAHTAYSDGTGTPAQGY